MIHVLKRKILKHKDNPETMVVLYFQRENDTTFNLMTERHYIKNNKVVVRTDVSYIGYTQQIGSKKFEKAILNYVDKKGFVEQFEF